MTINPANNDLNIQMSTGVGSSRSDGVKDLSKQVKSLESRGKNVGCISKYKIIGLAALVVGIALIAIAGLSAMGLWGGGSMYLVAGGATLISIPFFLIAAWFLCDEPPAIRITGSRQQLEASQLEQNGQTPVLE